MIGVSGQGEVVPRHDMMWPMGEFSVIDGHNDVPWAYRESFGYDLDRRDFGELNGSLHTDLPRLRAGSVAAQFWSVFVPSTLPGPDAVVATLEQIDFVHRLVARHPELELVRTADELEAAMAAGRIGSLIGVEGGHSIDQSLAVLRMMHILGARYLTLTHNDNTPWAGSATDEPVPGGLTELGCEIVSELNQLGMMVDLSHVSADTMRAALRVTKAPVIFSHSNARAVCDVARNVPDDVLVQLAGNGGVCMVTFVPLFTSSAVAQWQRECSELALERGLDPRDEDVLNRLMRERSRTEPEPVSTIGDVVAHLEHIRELIGTEHIGIGGDFDGTESVTRGLEDTSTYPRLFAALIERGWQSDEIVAVARGNITRVLRDVESSAG